VAKANRGSLAATKRSDVAWLNEDQYEGYRLPNGSKPADFVKYLQRHLNAFRAHQFGKLDVETLVDELESVVGRYRREVRDHAERIIQILMKREYVYGDYTDLWSEWSILTWTIIDSPSLIRTASVQIRRAYESARLHAALHGGGEWPKQCPWPTLRALRRALRMRHREYRELERKGSLSGLHPTSMPRQAKSWPPRRGAVASATPPSPSARVRSARRFIRLQGKQR